MDNKIHCEWYTEEYYWDIEEYYWDMYCVKCYRFRDWSKDELEEDECNQQYHR